MATDRIVSLFGTATSPRFRLVERIREREALRDREDEAEKNALVVARWPYDPDANKENPAITEAQIARMRFELLVAGGPN